MQVQSPGSPGKEEELLTTPILPVSVIYCPYQETSESKKRALLVIPPDTNVNQTLPKQTRVLHHPGAWSFGKMGGVKRQLEKEQQ
jgi:hypothetical protein